jgi:O-antigen/teichoic acid export membrane protein
MSLSMIGTGFGSVLTAMQRRKLEFRSLALRSLGGRAGSALIAITLVVQGAGVWALVVQQVLLVCLGTLTLWLLSDQRPRFGFHWPSTRELLRFGWLSTVHQLMNILVPRMFMVLVGAFLGSKVAGMLSLAFRGLDMLRDLLAVALSQVAMPVFARLQDDRSALFDAYTRSVRMTALVTYPIFVGLAICAEEVLLVVFGAQWVSAAPYFMLISLLALPHFFRLYSNSLLRATGQPAAPIAEFVGQAACVLIGMLLVGRYSAWLAMLVWTGRLLVSIPIDFWILRRVSGMSYAQQMQGPLTPGLAAAGMACVVALARLGFLDALPPALRLVPIGVIGAASYAALLVVLDRDLVRQFVSFIGQSIQSRGRA